MKANTFRRLGFCFRFSLTSAETWRKKLRRWCPDKYGETSAERDDNSTLVKAFPGQSESSVQRASTFSLLCHLGDDQKPNQSVGAQLPTTDHHRAVAKGARDQCKPGQVRIRFLQCLPAGGCQWCAGSVCRTIALQLAAAGNHLDRGTVHDRTRAVPSGAATCTTTRVRDVEFEAVNSL